MRKSNARLSKSEPEGTKSQPMVTESERIGSQREPTESQKGAKGSQTGAESEPRDDQNTFKKRPLGMVLNMLPKCSLRVDSAGPFWEPFSIKQTNIDAVIDTVRKNNEHR